MTFEQIFPSEGEIVSRACVSCLFMSHRRRAFGVAAVILNTIQIPSWTSRGSRRVKDSNLIK